jgi:hypothetical protein
MGNITRGVIQDSDLLEMKNKTKKNKRNDCPLLCPAVNFKENQNVPKNGVKYCENLILLSFVPLSLCPLVNRFS